MSVTRRGFDTRDAAVAARAYQSRGVLEGPHHVLPVERTTTHHHHTDDSSSFRYDRSCSNSIIHLKLYSPLVQHSIGLLQRVLKTTNRANEQQASI